MRGLSYFPWWGCWAIRFALVPLRGLIRLSSFCTSFEFTNTSLASKTTKIYPLFSHSTQSHSSDFSGAMKYSHSLIFTLAHTGCYATCMVGVLGLEPRTSRSQSAHSSQLSYTPITQAILPFLRRISHYSRTIGYLQLFLSPIKTKGLFFRFVNPSFVVYQVNEMNFECICTGLLKWT